jgi:hypothetical protein
MLRRMVMLELDYVGVVGILSVPECSFSHQVVVVVKICLQGIELVMLMDEHNSY